MSIVIRNIRKQSLEAVPQEVKEDAIKIRKLENRPQVTEFELPDTPTEFQFLERIIIDNERY